MTIGHVPVGALPDEQIDVPEGEQAVRLVPRAAARVRGAHAGRRREVVLGPRDDEERQLERLEALGVVRLLAAEALLRRPLEQVGHVGRCLRAIERQAEVLLEDVRLERAGVPAPQRKRVERLSTKRRRRPHREAHGGEDTSARSGCGARPTRE